jgi:hypothetical protein
MLVWLTACNTQDNRQAHPQTAGDAKARRPTIQVPGDQVEKLIPGGKARVEAKRSIGRRKGNEAFMWKINRTETGQAVVLSVCGRIEAEQLAELQKVFAAETQAVTLDLKEVKLVDQDAVNFLARCQAEGTKLENCPAYIREWIARAETAHETPEV